jgi:hypothetical protein
MYIVIWKKVLLKSQQMFQKKIFSDRKENFFGETTFLAGTTTP